MSERRNWFVMNMIRDRLVRDFLNEEEAESLAERLNRRMDKYTKEVCFIPDHH